MARTSVLGSLCLLMLLTGSSAGASTRDERAAALLREAQARIAQGTSAERQFARGLLEDALRLAPDDPEIRHALGHLYLEADMMFAARRLAEATLRKNPDDAESHFTLGETWRREWFVRGEETLRDRAILSLARGLRRAPDDFAHARMLVPMLEDAGERQDAYELAKLVARHRPQDPLSLMLVAYTAQCAGDIATADRLFRRALPQLAPEKRRVYEDVSPLLWLPVAEDYRRLTSSERERFNAEFWQGTDPDPTTPEHEGQLEYWSRVTHSELLYGRNALGIWDMRAQLYIRFGPPSRIDRSLLSSTVSTALGTWSAWSYQDLGMRVWMRAANSLGRYGSPFALSEQAAVRAFPDSLLAHPEYQSVQGGYAVFRRLPLDAEPLRLASTIVRLTSGEGALLLAQAEVESPPADRLSAHWVLIDSLSAVVASATNSIGASACAPGSLRAASFATGVSPGRYRLAIRVEDENVCRAVTAQDVVIAPAPRALALSDLALVCGTSAASIVPGTGVRLEPSTGLRPLSGDALLAYFEVYHLVPGSDGQREFEYVCTVSPVVSERRSWLRRAIDPASQAEPIVMTRQESTASDVRRQFFSVPVKSLPPGRYHMQVRVTDLVSRSSTATLAEFVRH